MFVKSMSEPRSGFVYLLGYLKIAFEVGILGLLIYILLKSNKSPTELFESKTHVVIAENSNVTFNDVKGIEECRAELEEIV